MKKIFLILFIVLSCGQANELEKVSLQLKWKYQFQFAGFIMAKEKGFYKDVGLDVELLEFNTSVNMIEDLQKEKIDFATSDSALILEALVGVPVVALMSVLQNSPYALMALKSSGINSLDDIYGKKISLYDDFNGMAISAMLFSHHIEYVKTPLRYSLDSLLNGENDMLTVYLSNEPFVAKEMKLEVSLLRPKDYGFDEYGDILFTSQKMLKNRPELVEKMYEASKKGWEYAFSHIDESADVLYKKYNTLNKSKKALLYDGETLKSLSGYGENFGQIDEDRVKNIAQIFSFMKQGKKNFENLKEFIYKPKNSKIDRASLFTKEELEYIDSKKSIKVCATKEQFPFVIFNTQETIGMSIEFLKQIANKTHLNFEIIEAKNITEHLTMIQEGICDVAPIIIAKPNLFKFLVPTKPMGSDSIVLVTKLTEPYVDNFNDLQNKKIAIQKGSKNLIHYVKSLYPNMNLVEIENFSLNRIENGEFYGVIATTYKMAYKISTDYPNTLKIMSKIGDTKIDGSFGITIREPILLSIFNKSLDNIAKLDKQKIASAWLSVNVEKQIDYNRLLQVVSVALLIIMTLIFFYVKQRKLKIQIENEKDKFENIFNNARDGITILTNGIFTDCNIAIINLLAFKEKKELLNLTPSQLSPKYQPDGRLSLEKSVEMMQLAIKNGYNNFQWVHKKADESEFWCDIMLTDISLRQDEQIIHVVWRDISKQKELENEILQINTHLEQKVQEEVEKNEQQQLLMLHQNRLAQMGEMISMIAHQWRQPLNTLAVLNQTIVLKYKRGKLDDTLVDTFNESSKKQINQMSNTIDDFRDFFKPEKEKNEFYINDVVWHVLDILKPVFALKNIHITFEEQSRFNIIGYPNELGQAMLNIISNAKDALLEKTIKEKKINISLKKIDNEIVLLISDNAGGVPDTIIDQIFNPYFSTKLEKNGTGLGLYMTKMIVEEHMGAVLSVANDENGAVFKICF